MPRVTDAPLAFDRMEERMEERLAPADERVPRPAARDPEVPPMTQPWRTRDKHWRSAAKAASWRLTGSMDTILVSWLVTGRFALALSIGGIEVFTKIVLYYLHERLWERLPFGRKAPREPEYYI